MTIRHGDSVPSAWGPMLAGCPPASHLDDADQEENHDNNHDDADDPDAASPVIHLDPPADANRIPMRGYSATHVS
jgi:hypothetical protein